MLKVLIIKCCKQLKILLQLTKIGATIERVSLPSMDYGAAIYFIISRAEVASNLARFDGVRYGLRNKKAKTLLEMYEKSRHDGFGEEVKKRIMIGNYVLSVGHAGEFYANAVKAQNIMRAEFNEMFKNVDLLLRQHRQRKHSNLVLLMIISYKWTFKIISPAQVILPEFLRFPFPADFQKTSYHSDSNLWDLI